MRSEDGGDLSLSSIDIIVYVRRSVDSAESESWAASSSSTGLALRPVEAGSSMLRLIV